jgi:hypothetical protein
MDNTPGKQCAAHEYGEYDEKHISLRHVNLKEHRRAGNSAARSLLSFHHAMVRHSMMTHSVMLHHHVVGMLAHHAGI